MSRKDVKLIPQGQPGSFKWKVVHDGKESDNPANYPKVNLPEGSGPHLIIFELTGNHAGIKFSQDPIWVQAGGKPKQKAGHPQIPVAVPMDQGKKLIVLDRNDNDPSEKLELHYQLNFDGAPMPLDPIIKNGGGTVDQPGPHLALNRSQAFWEPACLRL